MEYKLELTDKELNHIHAVLMDRPYREVVELINKITEQVKEQNVE